MAACAKAAGKDTTRITVAGIPGGMMGGGGGGMGGGMMPDPNLFPEPEYDENRIMMQPFNFMAGGNYLAAFLKTLSDGYVL